MKYRKFIFTCSLLFPCYGFAQIITLDSAVEKFWTDSPQLQELELQYKLTEKDRWRRYLPNNPSLVFEKDESDSSQRTGFELNMGFPGKAFALSALDDATIQAKKREVQSRKFSLADLMTQAYIDCASAQRALRIRENARNDVENLLESLKSKRAIIPTEKLGFELEVRQSIQELNAARDAQDVKCARLQSLLGDTSSLPTLELPSDIPGKILQQLGSITPEEGQILSTVQLAEAKEKTAWWKQMPDLTLSYSEKWFPRSPDESGRQKFPVMGISIGLPLLFPFQESVEYRQARSQALTEKLEARLEKNRIEFAKIEAGKSFRRAQMRLKEIKTKDIPLAQSLVESAYSAYRAGQVGYAEMVISRKALIDLRLQELELSEAAVTARLKCLESCETIATSKGTNR